MGRLAVTDSDSDKRRFLTRHPEAEMYAAFTDFAFYRFEIERAITSAASVASWTSSPQMS